MEDISMAIERKMNYKKRLEISSLLSYNLIRKGIQIQNLMPSVNIYL